VTTAVEKGKCPVTHHEPSLRKTNPDLPHEGPPVRLDERGVWHIYGFAEARELLRHDAVVQAGFMSESVRQVGAIKNQPVLFMDGEAHHSQRAATARFFTPATASAKYRDLMESLSTQLVAKLRREGRADLSDLSLELAVQVAAKVVGLTDSRLPGMPARILGFIKGGDSSPTATPNRVGQLRNQLATLLFHMLDVRPAIAERRRAPQEDVISHLLSRGYSEPEILIECITYGAAGMVTTREFIVAASWHLLGNEPLKARYLEANETERHAILGELLRLEPVVGTLYRRTTGPVALGSGHGIAVIPEGALVEVHVYDANADERTVGECPLEAHALRPLPKSVQPPVASFGDGHHRCPGSFIAIQETDIFLSHLLAIPGLRMESPPRMVRNETVKGYELRGLMLSVPREVGVA
jgi:cytochrome P450